MIKLSNKQSVFIDEYLVDFNASRAARDAGYSEKTARVKGSQLLAKVNIQAELQKRLAKRADETEINARWVQEKLKRNEQDAYADGDLQQSTKNIELLGKTCAAFTDVIENDTTVNIIFKQPTERE